MLRECRNCHYTFIRTRRIYNANSEPYCVEFTMPIVNPIVKYVLWVIMKCQCTFTDCNRSTTLLQDVDSGGGFVCLGSRNKLGNFYTFPSVLL